MTIITNNVNSNSANVSTIQSNDVNISGNVNKDINIQANEISASAINSPFIYHAHEARPDGDNTSAHHFITRVSNTRNSFDACIFHFPTGFGNPPNSLLTKTYHPDVFSIEMVHINSFLYTNSPTNTILETVYVNKYIASSGDSESFPIGFNTNHSSFNFYKINRPGIYRISNYFTAYLGYGASRVPVFCFIPMKFVYQSNQQKYQPYILNMETEIRLMPRNSENTYHCEFVIEFKEEDITKGLLFNMAYNVLTYWEARYTEQPDAGDGIRGDIYTSNDSYIAIEYIGPK